MATKQRDAGPFMQYTARGLKSFDFSPWGGLEGFLASTSMNAATGTKGSQLKRVNPWLAKATNMTANAVSSLPFVVSNEAGEEIDSSDDWQNKVGGIPNPKRLLKLLASSLCGGAAYMIPQVSSSLILDVQYVAPHTITPYIDINGLEYFDRSTDQGKVERLAPEEITYFWLPDSDVEIGPALSHPLGTATLSASLLYQADMTLTTYAQRGFVPATILGAKGMPIESKRIEMEMWWDRFLRGWSNVVAKIFNAETLTVQRVGAGLEELKGIYPEINGQQIENIGAAYGIPAGLFMSDKAYATEMDVLMREWYDTSEFRAIYQTIEETLTEQLLSRWGYRWQFKPETLDIYQADENDRSQSFATYVGAGFKPSVAAEMLGIELPDGVEYESLDESAMQKQEQERQLAEAQVQKLTASSEQPTNGNGSKPPPPAKTLTADEIKDLNLWRQTAVRQFVKGKSPAIDWECKALSEPLAGLVRDRLRTAKSEDEINKAFEIGGDMLIPDGILPAPERSDKDVQDMALALNRIADLEGMKALVPAQQPIVVNTTSDMSDRVGVAMTEAMQILTKGITDTFTGLPAPIVNVPAPIITVEAQEPAQIKVSVPAPIVNIENVVKIPRLKKQKQTIKRGANDVMTGSESTFEYEDDK